MLQSHKILLLIAVLLIGGFIWYGNDKRSDAPGAVENETQQTETMISVKVDDGEGEIESYPEVTFNSGDTALDITESVTEVEMSGEGETAFVTKIGDREADSDKNEFWSFMINGDAAQVGAGSYEVENGDDISWEIETY